MSDNWQLRGYAPNGKRIVATFEATLGSQDVAFFYKADDGRVFHEYGDDLPEIDDSVTVCIGDDAVYMDEDGQLWLENAITLKDEEGKVVHEGSACEPLVRPGIEFAMELAMRAYRSKGTRKAGSEAQWNAITERGAFGPAARIAMLEGFVRELGLMPALAAYAAGALEKHMPAATA